MPSYASQQKSQSHIKSTVIVKGQFCLISYVCKKRYDCYLKPNITCQLLLLLCLMSLLLLTHFPSYLQFKFYFSLVNFVVQPSENDNNDIKTIKHKNQDLG